MGDPWEEQPKPLLMDWVWRSGCLGLVLGSSTSLMVRHMCGVGPGTVEGVGYTWCECFRQGCSPGNCRCVDLGYIPVEVSPGFVEGGKVGMVCTQGGKIIVSKEKV